jgi:hypothetical protein
MKHAVCIIAIVIVAMLSGCNDVTTPLDPTRLDPASVQSLAKPVTLPHKERASGTVTAVAPGFQAFSGSGTATHFGRYTQVGNHNFDEFGNVLNGVFTTTTADGSTISGTYAGTYTLLPSGNVRFDVHPIWVQGTGRLAGVTGEGDVVAILTGVEVGDTFTYKTTATLTFP